MRSQNQAPEGFWPEVFGLDSQLYANAPHQGRKHFIWPWAEDKWQYIASLEEYDETTILPDNRLREAWWRKARIGSAVIGSIKVFQPMVQVFETSDTTRPVLETAYRYTFEVRKLSSARLLVAHHGHDIEEMQGVAEAESPQEKQHREAHLNQAIKEGLCDPTPEQYQTFLEEMRRGASGEYRIPPSA